MIRRIVWVALAVWCAGFVAYLARVPTQPADTTTRTDAIVVLTGPEDGRISHGLDLYAAGLAPQMLVSGVDPGVDQTGVLYWAHRPGLVLPHGFTVGQQAQDTVGNAVETAQFVCRNHIGSLRLITADYHMPRALWLLRQALPHTTILPDAVIWSHGPQRSRWYWVTRGLTRRLTEFPKDVVQHALRKAGLMPELDTGCPVP